MNGFYNPFLAMGASAKAGVATASATIVRGEAAGNKGLQGAGDAAHHHRIGLRQRPYQLKWGISGQQKFFMLHNNGWGGGTGVTVWRNGGR